MSPGSAKAARGASRAFRPARRRCPWGIGASLAVLAVLAGFAGFLAVPDAACAQGAATFPHVSARGGAPASTAPASRAQASPPAAWAAPTLALAASPATARTPGGVPEDIRGDARVAACLRAALREPERLAMIVPQVGGEVELHRTERALWVLFHGAHLARLRTEGTGADGRFSRIEATLTDVNLYGLKLVSVSMTAQPVHLLDRALAGEDLRLLGSTRVTMSATVTESDLDAMSRAGRMILSDGGLTLIGRPDGILGASTRVNGRIAVTPANQLVLQARSVMYGIVPVPRFIYGPKVAALNPLFDLDAFLGSTKESFDIRFQSVKHEKGKLTITLTGDLHPPSPQAIAAAKAAQDAAAAAGARAGVGASTGGAHGDHRRVVSPAAARPIGARDGLGFVPQPDPDRAHCGGDARTPATGSASPLGSGGSPDSARPTGGASSADSTRPMGGAGSADLPRPTGGAGSADPRRLLGGAGSADSPRPMDDAGSSVLAIPVDASSSAGSPAAPGTIPIIRPIHLTPVRLVPMAVPTATAPPSAMTSDSLPAAANAWHPGSGAAAAMARHGGSAADSSSGMASSVRASPASTPAAPTGEPEGHDDASASMAPGADPPSPEAPNPPGSPFGPRH